MKRLKTLSRFLEPQVFQTEIGLPFCHLSEGVSRDFILPEIYKRCLFYPLFNLRNLFHLIPMNRKIRGLGRRLLSCLFGAK